MNPETETISPEDWLWWDAIRAVKGPSAASRHFNKSPASRQAEREKYLDLAHTQPHSHQGKLAVLIVRAYTKFRLTS